MYVWSAKLLSIAELLSILSTTVVTREILPDGEAEPNTCADVSLGPCGSAKSFGGTFSAPSTTMRWVVRVGST